MRFGSYLYKTWHRVEVKVLKKYTKDFNVVCVATYKHCDLTNESAEIQNF